MNIDGKTIEEIKTLDKEDREKMVKVGEMALNDERKGIKVFLYQLFFKNYE